MVTIRDQLDRYVEEKYRIDPELLPFSHENYANVSAEYALGGLSNQIFASTYTYIIPDKAKLIAQVETVLNQWND